MIDLALHNTGEYISLKDISARQNLTVKYLEQIVSSLGKAGFLQSMRGNSGGHRLAKNPSDIRIGDILRTMEGGLAPIGCIQGEEVSCPKVNECPTIEFWVGLDKVVNDYVNSYTLQDLVKQTKSLQDQTII